MLKWQIPLSSVVERVTSIISFLSYVHDEVSRSSRLEGIMCSSVFSSALLQTEGVKFEVTSNGIALSHQAILNVIPSSLLDTQTLRNMASVMKHCKKTKKQNYSSGAVRKCHHKRHLWKCMSVESELPLTPN